MAALAAIATIAATGLQVMGSLQQGKAQQAALNFQAKEQERQAKAEVAASQREAITKRQEGETIMSRQKALAASSGAGVVTPSILEIYGDTAEAADVNAKTALYGGQDRAAGLKAQATASRFKGEAAYKGSIFDAIGTGFGGVAKAFG